MTAVTGETLAGELTRAPLLANRHVTLRLADVLTIERAEASPGKTAAAGGAMLAGVALALAVTGLVFLLAVLSKIPGASDPPSDRPVPEAPRR